MNRSGRRGPDACAVWNHGEPLVSPWAPHRMSDAMIELDGSLGEGGGQILRTCLALSLLTGKAFHLARIRAGRKKPGLQPQHLMSVRRRGEGRPGERTRSGPAKRRPRVRARFHRRRHLSLRHWHRGSDGAGAAYALLAARLGLVHSQRTDFGRRDARPDESHFPLSGSHLAAISRAHGAERRAPAGALRLLSPRRRGGRGGHQAGPKTSLAANGGAPSAPDYRVQRDRRRSSRTYQPPSGTAGDLPLSAGGIRGRHSRGTLAGGPRHGGHDRTRAQTGGARRPGRVHGNRARKTGRKCGRRGHRRSCSFISRP